MPTDEPTGFERFVEQQEADPEMKAKLDAMRAQFRDDRNAMLRAPLDLIDDLPGSKPFEITDEMIDRAAAFLMSRRWAGNIDPASEPFMDPDELENLRSLWRIRARGILKAALGGEQA